MNIWFVTVDFYKNKVSTGYSHFPKLDILKISNTSFRSKVDKAPRDNRNKNILKITVDFRINGFNNYNISKIICKSKKGMGPNILESNDFIEKKGHFVFYSILKIDNSSTLMLHTCISFD